MTVLTLREYESTPIAEHGTTAPAQYLTRNEVGQLYRVGERLGIRLVEHVAQSRVRCTQYVGIVKMGERVLELLPKIEGPTGEGSIPEVRHNLLHMVLRAHDVEARHVGSGDVSVQSASWLDLLIRLFCRELAEQLRRGVARRYRTEEDDLPTVRGRILIAGQLRRNLIHAERIACEFDELDADNSLNHLFKLALHRMIRIATSTSTQQAARELLPVFEGVRDLAPGPWLLLVKTDRLTSRFDTCLGLAKLFLGGDSPDVTSGESEAFALLFDMNMLFEKFIGRGLQRVLRQLGHKTSLQDSRHYLARDVVTEKRVFNLRPDIVVTHDGTVLCIADTKWKRLAPDERKHGVSEADLYQMLAYADRYNCDTIMLLYPFHRSDGQETPVTWRLKLEGRHTMVFVSQVVLQDLKAVPAILLGIFLSATKHGDRMSDEVDDTTRHLAA